MSGSPQSCPDDVAGEVAAVMAVRNGCRFLPRQLESIRSQTRLPERLFVVDDWSTDGSYEYLRDISRQLPGWVTVTRSQTPVVRDKHTRIARAFEQALVQASDYRCIILSDQDDAWLPGRVEHQLQDLADGKRLMTCGVALLMDAQGAELTGTLRDSFPLGVDWVSAGAKEQLVATLRHPSVTGACTAVARQLLDLARPIPAGWLHDRWLALVAAGRGGLHHTDTPVIRYRLHSAQAVGERGGARHRRRARAEEVRRFLDVAVRLHRVAEDPMLKNELAPWRLLGHLRHLT